MGEKAGITEVVAFFLPHYTVGGRHHYLRGTFHECPAERPSYTEWACAAVVSAKGGTTHLQTALLITTKLAQTYQDFVGHLVWQPEPSNAR